MRYSRCYAVGILLSALVGIEAVLYVQLYISHSSLGSAYDTMKGDFSDLQSLHSELDAAYHSLNANYSSLEDSFNALEHQYAVIEQSYAYLLDDHNLETSLRIDSGLESYFDNVREEKMHAVRPSFQTKADFGADLALHGLGINCWPSLEDAYYQVAGRHSFESAGESIDYVIGILGVEMYDSPTEKIKKVLDFISDHISYEDEIGEVFLAPAETLAFRSGDCDDFSILVACLFKALGIEAAFGIFRNPDAAHHCMVLIRLDKLEGYEHLSFSDLTRFGLGRGKWIVIEPQFPISRQGLEWVGQWSLLVAAPLDVTE